MQRWKYLELEVRSATVEDDKILLLVMPLSLH